MDDIIYKFRLYGLKKFLLFAWGELIMRFRHRFFHSFSQYGDDVIIDRLLENKKNGFYVDVGAYDPIRFSNTMRFYLKGWKGINVEPDFAQFRKIEAVRKKDVNLNIGIASKSGTLTYWQMNPNTLSTFSEAQAKESIKEGFNLTKKMKIPVMTLASVLEKYAKRKHIDFLSVDVEGFELDVLKSNDWKKFRPRILCIELSFSGAESMSERTRKENLIRYVQNHGYHLRHKTPSNYIYESDN